MSQNLGESLLHIMCDRRTGFHQPASFTRFKRLEKDASEISYVYPLLLQHNQTKDAPFLVWFFPRRTEEETHIHTHRIVTMINFESVCEILRCHSTFKYRFLLIIQSYPSPFLPPKFNSLFATVHFIIYLYGYKQNKST